MARIEEFEAKDVKLTPSDKGYAAVEMAARRIGPLYQQMAAGQRELGNLTKASDEAIGKTTEAFLRFQGLSQQSSGAGVKVDKGGPGERTLLGTGSGEFGMANARANASNERRDDGGLAKPLVGQTAAEKTAAAKLQSEQLADQLKSQRDAADAQKKADRDAEDFQRAQDRRYGDTNGPPSNDTVLVRAAEDARVKAARDAQDAAIKQTRDTQDAAIKEGRAADVLAKLDYKTKGELSNGPVVISGTARDWYAANSPIGAQSTMAQDVTVIRGGQQTALRAAQQNALRAPGRTQGSMETGAGIGLSVGEAASPNAPVGLGDLPGDITEAMSVAQPTYMGDTPSITGAPPPQTNEQPAQDEAAATPQSSGSPDIPNSGPIYSPIDQPSAPGLYSDMTGGM